MSTVLIIDSLPMVVSVLTPMARDRAKASTTLASAPLCSATPIGPAVSGGGRVSANGADREWALTKPRQFGPSMVIPFAAARASIMSSRARPCGPTSR